MPDDVTSRYPQVAGNPLAMALLAEGLLGKGKAQDAFALAMAAVEAAPGDMQVRDVVRMGIAGKVPNWHGPMLHDHPRNAAYVAAIERIVRPGMRVLEIGSGAGLLSLVAARAGAEVYTCEANPIVAAAAAAIVARNGLADRITVIPKGSTELMLGEDLPGPADVLMSELFDDTLFGDDIVHYLTDARRLLVEGAAVIPRRSALRIALVDHPLPPARAPLGLVEGFDLSPFNLLAPAHELRARPKHTVPRSDPVSALPMDYMAPDSFGAIREQVSLISTGGAVGGFAQWLRIDFGDGIVFENDPFAGSRSHWGAPLYLFDQPVETAPGEAIDARIHLMRARLTIARAA